MKLQQAVVDLILKENSETQLIYHFGSSATGSETSASDVDLAILGSEPMSADQKFNLKTELFRMLGKDIDIVDLKQAAPSFCMQVFESGISVFAKSKQTLDEFEMNTISKFCNFVEERRALVKDIEERGSVYE